MIINKIQKSCIHLFPIGRLVKYQICRLKMSFFKKTLNFKFSYIEVWFTDQNFKQLEIEDKININLLIN